MRKILLLLTVFISSIAHGQQTKSWIYFTSGMTYCTWNDDEAKYEISEKDTADSYFYVDVNKMFIVTPDESYHITCAEGEYWECLDDDSTRCYLKVGRGHSTVCLFVVYYDHFREYDVDTESSNMY